MNWFILLGVALITFVLMEGFAWFTHKYILHGPLWFLHKSHHRVNDHWWEWNDLVSLSYGLAAMLLFMYGIENTASWAIGIGAGITLYGIFYFIFHDVIIHRRVKVKYSFSNKYILRLIRAHKIHHKHLQKEDSEAFGFLYADKKYLPK